MMTDEPTACLAGYTKQANLDPAQFNLSSTLGIERLKRFTLADPRLYVLNALAAAQSAPSRGLKIHCDADDMILTADTDVDFGPYLTDLSHRLLDEKCPPAVKELATAYQAAKGLKPAFVEVSTRSKRLHWAADRGEEVRDLQGTGLRLQVREKMSLRWIRKAISYRFGQLRLGTEEDALKPTAISHHCPP